MLEKVDIALSLGEMLCPIARVPNQNPDTFSPGDSR